MSHEGVSGAAAPARITRIDSEGLAGGYPCDPTGEGVRGREIGHYMTIWGMPAGGAVHEGERGRESP